MPKVYIIQDAPGKNLEPAKDHGSVVVMLTGKETADEALERLEHYLKDFQFEDYLLLVGNPVNIALASILVWELSTLRTINLLVWDREYYKYNIVRITP